MTWIFFALVIVVTLLLIPFTAYALSNKDIFFTRLETGDIKFIDHGKTLHRIIFDVSGVKLNENDLFVNTTTSRKRSWWGIYWLGIPGIASVHRFKITKELENPSGKNMDDWIIKTGVEEVSSLRYTFPRPYTFPKVELGDEDPVAIDVLAVAKFEVVDPIKLVYKLKGRFFENAGGILNAAVGDKLNNYTLADFINEDKGEVKGILSHLKEPGGDFNKALIEQVGLRLVGIAMRYDPSNEAVRQAMEAKTIAFHKGEARKAEADAEAFAQERLADASKKKIALTVEAMKGDAKAAADVLMAESQPNLTHRVDVKDIKIGGGK